MSLSLICKTENKWKEIGLGWTDSESRKLKICESFWYFGRTCVCQRLNFFPCLKSQMLCQSWVEGRTPQHPYQSHKSQIFTFPDLPTGQLELWYLNQAQPIGDSHLQPWIRAHEAGRLQNSSSGGDSQCSVSQVFEPDSSLGMNSIFWSCSSAFSLSLSYLISFQ